MLVASKSQTMVVRIKKLVGAEFDMKELGQARRVLGMEVCRNKSAQKLMVIQTQYIEKLMKKFGIDIVKTISIPLASYFKLSTNCALVTSDEEDYMKRVSYTSAVGCLMYLIACTTPDIAHNANLVRRYMNRLRKRH